MAIVKYYDKSPINSSVLMKKVDWNLDEILPLEIQNLNGIEIQFTEGELEKIAQGLLLLRNFRKMYPETLIKAFEEREQNDTRRKI